MEGWAECVWLNGRILPPADATVSVFDRSFMLGDGVFETMRAYGGRVFRLERHLTRLEGSAARIDVLLRWKPGELQAAVEETLAANKLDNAAIRLTLSRGIGAPGPAPSGCGATTVVIAARSFEGYPPHWYDPGATAIVSSITKNEQSPLCGVKTTSYLEHVLARAEAAEKKADESLLRNTRGHVVEGSATNLFVVIDEVLYTPDLTSGCLPGITREAVIELAWEAGITIREAPLRAAAVGGWDEAFLTNSLLGLAPLTRIDGRPVRSGRPGPITQALAKRYQSLVERETAPQPSRS